MNVFDETYVKHLWSVEAEQNRFPQALASRQGRCQSLPALAAASGFC